MSLLHDVRVRIGAGVVIPLGIEAALQLAQDLKTEVTIEDANGVDIRVAPDSDAEYLGRVHRAKQYERQSRPVVGPYRIAAQHDSQREVRDGD